MVKKECKTSAGRPQIDVVQMFKVIFLQRYYGLGDHQIEYQIIDRTSFRRFLGIRTVDEVPDEMRPIRCIEHKGHGKLITPFVDKQVDICKAFDFTIPDGCQPKYKSKKSKTGKRGRPAKPVIEAEPKD